MNPEPAVIPPLPPAPPRRHGPLARWIGRSVLRLGGWKVTGHFPDLPKLVIIAAPHSSAWDAVWGLAVKLALGVDAKFMAKAELFRGPMGWLLGWLLRGIGGVPTDRSAPGGIVGEMERNFADNERFWLAIAPEGTRREVSRWKTGFWRIAHAAGVPVLCVYFHYPEKTIGIGDLVTLSDDPAADLARILRFYRPWKGRYHDTLAPEADER